MELTDFTIREAMPLARGMSGNGRDGVLLLRRVLYWTSGHPYLSQRLCEAIATERSIRTPMQVDRLCRTLFLSKKARETDDNLSFVRNRMLKSDVDLFDLLELYVRIWRRLPLPFLPEEVIRADDSNPLVAVLLLAGVVRVSGRSEGALRIRNRIYRAVFDPAWAELSLPDGALRRQRVAVRRAPPPGRLRRRVHRCADRLARGDRLPGDGGGKKDDGGVGAPPLRRGHKSCAAGLGDRQCPASRRAVERPTRESGL